MDMIEIVVEHRGISEILPMLASMRERGWVLYRDFSFAYHYHTATFDNDGHEAVTPRHTVFTFFTEELATMFTLTDL